MKKYLAGIAVSFLLSAVAHAFDVSPETRTARVRIATYNLWGAPFSGKDRNIRIPEIGQALPSIAADLVGLQEVFAGCFVKDEPKMILQGVGGNFPYYVEGPTRYGMKCVNAGVMLLSRFPILDSDTVIYRRCSGTDCFARKGAIFARVLFPTVGEVDVFVTHANASDDGSIRLSQMQQLTDFIDEKSGDHSRPVLLLGDLNATPDTKEVQFVERRLGVTDAHDRYIFGRKVSDAERHCYTSDPVRNPNVPPTKARKRLDYLFFRGTEALPISVAFSRMIFEESDGRGKPMSDHFGVLGDLDFHYASSTEPSILARE